VTEQHNVYRDGKIHVLSEKCATCIFRPNERPVDGARVAEMVRDTMDEPGATVVCHKTLYDLDGKTDQEHAICRGWYDRLGDRDPILRLAQVMGVIQEQAA
jgi:hypothetical protein